jgi:hypothetical protein
MFNANLSRPPADNQILYDAPAAIAVPASRIDQRNELSEFLTKNIAYEKRFD